MLESIKWREGDELLQINSLVQYTDRPVRAFRARMEQLQAVHRWLAGYLHALSILVQIPGAAEYRWREPADDDEALKRVASADRDELLAILVAALARLGAAELIGQVPGADGRGVCLPGPELRIALAALDRGGLIHVVAGCLDRLLVIPHVGADADFHQPLRGPGFWRKTWRRLRGRIGQFVARS
jgi:hypothetical protein